jgi:hypothetical protein
MEAARRGRIKEPAPKTEKEEFAGGGGGSGVSRKKKREEETGPSPPHRIHLGGMCGLASVSTRVEDRRTRETEPPLGRPHGVPTGPRPTRISLLFFLFF